MDSRLTRGLSPDQAANVVQWFKESKAHLSTLVAILEAESASSLARGDAEEVFHTPQPLAVLAHQAGFREGVRAAVRLLRA